MSEMRRFGLIPKAITRRPVVELRSSCHLQQRAPAADPHEDGERFASALRRGIRADGRRGEG